MNHRAALATFLLSASSAAQVLSPPPDRPQGPLARATLGAGYQLVRYRIHDTSHRAVAFGPSFQLGGHVETPVAPAFHLGFDVSFQRTYAFFDDQSDPRPSLPSTFLDTLALGPTLSFRPPWPSRTFIQLGIGAASQPSRFGIFLTPHTQTRQIPRDLETFVGGRLTLDVGWTTRPVERRSFAFIAHIEQSYLVASDPTTVSALSFSPMLLAALQYE